MLTSEIAKKANVTLETVRFYTRKGLLDYQRDPSNGYKHYESDALNRLLFISQARHLGFSLKEIEEILETSEKGKSPCPSVRQMMAKKIQQTESKIQIMQNDLKKMKQAFESWKEQADGLPDDQSVCCLIETWSQQSQPKHTKESNQGESI